MELGKVAYNQDGTIDRAYMMKVLKACEKFNSARIKEAVEAMTKQRRELVETDLKSYEKVYEKLQQVRQATLVIV